MRHYRKQECHWRRYRRSGRVRRINPGIHYHSIVRKNPIDRETFEKVSKKVFGSYKDKPLDPKEVGAKAYLESLGLDEKTIKTIGKPALAKFLERKDDSALEIERIRGDQKALDRALDEKKISFNKWNIRQQRAETDLNRIASKEEQITKKQINDLKVYGALAEREPTAMLRFLGQYHGDLAEAKQQVVDLEKSAKEWGKRESDLMNLRKDNKISFDDWTKAEENITEEKKNFWSNKEKLLGAIKDAEKRIKIEEEAQKAGEKLMAKKAWPMRKQMFLDRVTFHAADTVGDIGKKITGRIVEDKILSRFTNRQLREQAVASAKAQAARTRYLYRVRIIRKPEAIRQLRDIKALLRANVIAATKGLKMED